MRRKNFEPVAISAALDQKHGRPPSPEYRLSAEGRTFIVDGVEHGFFGKKELAASPLTTLHLQSRCKGRYCVIHKPSSHFMRLWPLIWDTERIQMYRLCKHGLVHPDPDDFRYWKDVSGGGVAGAHVCCTKCFPEFPCTEYTGVELSPERGGDLNGSWLLGEV